MHNLQPGYCLETYKLMKQMPSLAGVSGWGYTDFHVPTLVVRIFPAGSGFTVVTTGLEQKLDSWKQILCLKVLDQGVRCVIIPE